MKRLLLIACWLFFIALKSHAQTALYVDSSISASGSGTSWTTAYKTLNEALNVVNAGALSTRYVVNVAKGTYYPTGTRSAVNRDSTYLIGRWRLKVNGGFPSGGGSRNISANPTILSGSLATTNSYHVFVFTNNTVSSTTDSVEIDGLSITGADITGATGAKSYNGISVNRSYGTACIYNFAGKVVFTNCSFYRNSGGAVYNMGGSVVVGSCSFLQNQAASGAAINNNAGSLEVDTTSFTANTASGAGGAIRSNMYTQISIRRSNFSYDTSNYEGGAIYMYYATSSFSGCTFTNNFARSASSFEGGGAFCLFGGSDSLVNCQITNNRSDHDGGGGFIYGSTSFIKDCSFVGNTDTNANALYGGGGLFIENSSSGAYQTTIINSVFMNNRSKKSGGGLLLFNSSTSPASISHCTFSGNIAEGDGGGFLGGYYLNFDRCRFTGNTGVNGGGIYLGVPTSSTLTSLTNCLITGNKAQSSGGGLYIDTYSPSISNCTFAGDTATNGYSIAMAGYSSAYISAPAITNCILWDGVNSLYTGSFTNPTITYSIVRQASGVRTGTGNLNVDPLFTAPSVLPIPNTGGDYRLLPCSPAVNSGQNLGSYTSVLDAADSPRLAGTVVDRGALEYQGTYSLPPAITGNSAVCVNDTIRLSHSITGGTWSSVNPAKASVSATGLVTGLVAGTDTIVYTVSNYPGCIAGVQKSITINALPSVAAIGGNVAVCVNDSMQQTNATAGGTWSSSNTSVATISSTGMVTAIGAGNDTIHYTVTSAAGCTNTVSKTIMINARPAVVAITGSNTLCVSATTTLGNATSGGTWSSTNTSLATVSSTGVVTGIAAGTDTIIYTVSGSVGCPASAIMLVTINALPVVPAINGGNSICLGSAAQLTNSAPNGIWSSSNTAVAVIDAAGNVSAIAPGAATIFYTVTNANGCVQQVSKVVTVNQVDTSVQQNGAQLSARLANAASYQWVDCNAGHVPIAGATGQSYMATTNGSYAVVINALGCSDTSACFTVAGLGMNGPAQAVAAYSIYPNPASGILQITTEQQAASRIIIRDFAAREVLQIIPAGRKSLVDISALQNGLYLVEICLNDRKWTSRINVVH